jgi:hypothetical protein
VELAGFLVRQCNDLQESVGRTIRMLRSTQGSRTNNRNEIATPASLRFVSIRNFRSVPALCGKPRYPNPVPVVKSEQLKKKTDVKQKAS